MVLQNPEDLLPEQGPKMPSEDECRDDEPNALPSPSSTSSLSSPSSPSTSALSTPANPNDDNSSEDKATERTPFIDPEDVIGRRVMFDLPPLMLDSGWGIPTKDISCKGARLSMNDSDMPSPEDDIQSMTTNFTSISESEFPKELALVDSLSSSERGELSGYLLNASKPATELKILTSHEDCADASLMNDIGLLHKPKHLMEALIYDDFGFLHWNWPLIRRACKVTLISIMMGMLCIAVALIATAPRTCEPARFWWQGGVLYEVFPATFQDSDGDIIGDFKGLIHRLDYIASLGVAAVRLNSIFESSDYPSKYWSVLNHTSIAPQLGTMDDFQELVKQLHARNLKLILDFNPVFVDQHHPLVDGRNLAFSTEDFQVFDNRTMATRAAVPNPSMMTNLEYRTLNLSHAYVQQELQDAIQFWLSKGVDGFYMKYLEHLEITPRLLFNLLEWRSILDGAAFHYGRKILIGSGTFLQKLEGTGDGKAEAYVGLFDMADYQLSFNSAAIEDLLQTIENCTARHLRTAIPHPWILWSAGSSERSKLADHLSNEQAFASILFQLLLPGTINIFAGDELLEQNNYPDDNKETSTTRGLVPLWWMTRTESRNFSMQTLLSTQVSHTKESNASNPRVSLDVLKEVIKLRNVSTPLYVAATLHQRGHEDIMIPNYKIHFHKSGALVLERFYPRWKSFIILVNLGNSSQHLDLSSRFYQGKIIVSTREERGSFVFRDVHLKIGEAVIVQL